MPSVTTVRYRQSLFAYQFYGTALLVKVAGHFLTPFSVDLPHAATSVIKHLCNDNFPNCVALI